MQPHFSYLLRFRIEKICSIQNLPTVYYTLWLIRIRGVPQTLGPRLVMTPQTPSSTSWPRIAACLPFIASSCWYTVAVESILDSPIFSVESTCSPQYACLIKLFQSHIIIHRAKALLFFSRKLILSIKNCISIYKVLWMLQLNYTCLSKKGEFLTFWERKFSINSKWMKWLQNRSSMVQCVN